LCRKDYPQISLLQNGFPFFPPYFSPPPPMFGTFSLLPPTKPPFGVSENRQTLLFCLLLWNPPPGEITPVPTFSPEVLHTPIMLLFPTLRFSRVFLQLHTPYLDFSLLFSECPSVRMLLPTSQSFSGLPPRCTPPPPPPPPPAPRLPPQLKKFLLQFFLEPDRRPFSYPPLSNLRAPLFLPPPISPVLVIEYP